MSYELLIERRAEKDLKKLEASLFTVVADKIKSLSENPHPAGSRKLSGSQNDWRIRIGDYRILYEIDNKARKRSCELNIGVKSIVTNGHDTEGFQPVMQPVKRVNSSLSSEGHWEE